MIPDCDRRSDGRSDGQTESIIAKTALCIASYADALSKIIVRLKTHVGLFSKVIVCFSMELMTEEMMYGKSGQGCLILWAWCARAHGP